MIQYVKIEGKYHSNPFEILNVFKIGKVSVIHLAFFCACASFASPTGEDTLWMAPLQTRIPHRV